jgi:hypothetical protein
MDYKSHAYILLRNSDEIRSILRQLQKKRTFKTHHENCV